MNRYGLVAIKLSNNLSLDDISRKLKLDLYKEDKVSLEEAVGSGECRIGLYNGILLICVNDIFTYFLEEFEGLASQLMTSFNNAKMCAIYYYTIPDVFGYSYFENGKRTRTKYGKQDTIWVDIGDKLPIEKESESIEDIDNWIVQEVAGEKLTILIGKNIDLMRFHSNDY